MMFSSPPRLRMFAGPNGSGKSSLKAVLDRKLLGIYINPDEIEAGIKSSDVLNFNDFAFETSESEIREFFP